MNKDTIHALMLHGLLSELLSTNLVTEIISIPHPDRLLPSQFDGMATKLRLSRQSLINYHMDHGCFYFVMRFGGVAFNVELPMAAIESVTIQELEFSWKPYQDGDDALTNFIRSALDGLTNAVTSTVAPELRAAPKAKMEYLPPESAEPHIEAIAHPLEYCPPQK